MVVAVFPFGALTALAGLSMSVVPEPTASAYGAPGHRGRRRREDIGRARVETGGGIVKKRADHNSIAADRHRNAEAVDRRRRGRPAGSNSSRSEQRRRFGLN